MSIRSMFGGGGGGGERSQVQKVIDRLEGWDSRHEINVDFGGLLFGATRCDLTGREGVGWANPVTVQLETEDGAGVYSAIQKGWLGANPLTIRHRNSHEEIEAIVFAQAVCTEMSIGTGSELRLTFEGSGITRMMKPTTQGV